MSSVYTGQHGEISYASLALHHQPILRTTLKRVIQCVDDITVKGNKPLVCADFGTGEGTLAVKIFEEIQDHLCSKKDEREILIMLNDHEINIFNPLLNTFKESKLWNNKISILMSGKNMYDRCFPTKSLDLASSYMAMFKYERIPVQLENELFVCCAKMTKQERAIFQTAMLGRWCEFMKARSVELKLGGYLVVVVPCISDTSKEFGTVQGGFRLLSDLWQSFCEDHKHEELKHVTLPLYHWCHNELLLPFKDGVYEGLRLVSMEFEECGTYTFPESTGNQTKDAKMEARISQRTTLHLRSWMTNDLKKALPHSLTDTDQDDLLDTFFVYAQNRLSKGDQKDTSLTVAEIILQKM